MAVHNRQPAEIGDFLTDKPSFSTIPGFHSYLVTNTQNWKKHGHGHRFQRFYPQRMNTGVIERDLQKPTKKILEEAMPGHLIAEAQLVGTYQKGE